jgi:hypothetical protein
VTSATASLLNTFCRTLDKDFTECHLVLSKEKSPSRRQVTVTETLPSATVTWQRSFASFFAECIRRHSVKVPSLPSASCPSSWRREHQWVPLLVHFPSAFGGTRKGCLFAECRSHNTRQRSFTDSQVCLIYRVLWSWHSVKYLFVECYTRQSDQNTSFLFVLAIPSKQTKDISHIHHRYQKVIIYIKHTT